MTQPTVVTVDVLSILRETYSSTVSSLAQSKAMHEQKREMILNAVHNVGRSLLLTKAINAFHCEFVSENSLSMDVVVRYHGNEEPVRVRVFPPDDPHGRQLEIGVRYTELVRRQAQLTKELEALQKECIHPNAIRKGRSSTGNWDPHDNRYWYECSCSDCGKRWTEDQ